MTLSPGQMSPSLSEITRVQKDFFDKAEVFHSHNITKTIVFFGSARLEDPEEARHNLLALEMSYSQTKDIPPTVHQEALSRAKAKVAMSHYYLEAEELAHRLGMWSKEKKHEYAICTGGGPGIMRAANQGAYRAGATSIGLNIQIPTEQDHNPFITPGLKLWCETFYARKYWFFNAMKALLIFPGGLGTFDELFEVLNLIVTEKLDFTGPIVLYGKDFWKNAFNLEFLIQHAVVFPIVRDYIFYADTVEEAFQHITSRLSAEKEI